jgi:aminomethyltransferase
VSAGSLSTPALRKTALNGIHRQLGAKMVDFGGWDMPVEYSGISAEHMAVRTAVGLFDVSHMGDIQFRGPGSLAAIQALSMNDASKLANGQAQYSAMLYPQGTFVDDVLVHKFSDNDYLLVINAGTREKDYQWIRSQVGSFAGLHISDYSDHYTQLAIQGPRAAETLSKLTKVDLSKVKNYWFTWGTVCGLPNVLIARTGYTGEDGFEIYVPSDEATSERVWHEVLEAGKPFGILPCGLGARNTLRLEAAMALYGHEISEEINLLESGLERFSKLGKSDFLGSQALLELQRSGAPKRKLVGLQPGRRAHRLRHQRIPFPLFEKEHSARLCAGRPHHARDRGGSRDTGKSGQGEGGADSLLPPPQKNGLTFAAHAYTNHAVGTWL